MTMTEHNESMLSTMTFLRVSILGLEVMFFSTMPHQKSPHRFWCSDNGGHSFLPPLARSCSCAEGTIAPDGRCMSDGPRDHMVDQKLREHLLCEWGLFWRVDITDDMAVSGDDRGHNEECRERGLRDHTDLRGVTNESDGFILPVDIKLRGSSKKLGSISGQSPS